MTAFPSLPCYPCPHASSCCAYGSTLSDDEAAEISRVHGPGMIFRTRWGEWRTRVRNRRCVFLRENVCTIHAQTYYPAVCRGFPWTDAETGGAYEYDRTICPEFISRPELVQIGLPVAPEPRRRRTAVPKQPVVTRPDVATDGGAGGTPDINRGTHR